MFGDLQVTVLNQDRKKRTVYSLKRLEAAAAPAPPPHVPEPADDEERDEVDPWG